MVVSFAEYLIHRHIMHRQLLWGWLYKLAPDLKEQFHEHAVLHHGTYYKQFDYEPTEEGKMFNLRIHWPDTFRLFVVFAPLNVALWYYVSPWSTLTMMVMIAGHNRLWSLVHVQMHVPEGNAWFRHTRYFRFIARHHFMHHRQTARNYNVVVPLADFIMGRVATPRISDVREMVRLGYFDRKPVERQSPEEHAAERVVAA